MKRVIAYSTVVFNDELWLKCDACPRHCWMVINATSIRRAPERILMSHASDLRGRNWSKRQPREINVRPVEIPNKIGFRNETGPSHSPPTVNQINKWNPPKITSKEPLRLRSFAADDAEVLNIGNNFLLTFRCLGMVKPMMGGIKTGGLSSTKKSCQSCSKTLYKPAAYPFEPDFV